MATATAMSANTSDIPARNLGLRITASSLRPLATTSLPVDFPGGQNTSYVKYGCGCEGMAVAGSFPLQLAPRDRLTSERAFS